MRFETCNIIRLKIKYWEFLRFIPRYFTMKDYLEIYVVLF